MPIMIHIVSTDYKNQSGTDSWYWDRDEAYGDYKRRVEEVGGTHTVKLSRLDVDEALSEIVGEAVSEIVAEAVARDTAETLDSHEPEVENEAVWGELEFRPEGYFYIERTKASTSEYWPYRVEVNESHEGGYAVIDHTTDTLIGVVVPSPNTPAFKASVNGHEADQQFTNLKGAVVHIATEYNGV